MLELQDLKNKFGIIGNSDGLNYALGSAEKVAPTDLTVLITGESGSGKEVFSQIIHQLSPRRHHPFIAVNCGAIPEGTIDSELFGHEKGSFTGATDKRKGYFESVDKGTIFLDEIGEMPMGTQARLLRLLQNGEFMKVGSSTTQKVNVRVIAATNVNLMERVQKGKFREDLYYRLNTVPIEVPPLRDRGEDIVLLFRKFTVDFCELRKRKPPRLSEGAMDMLMKYRWPGNVRQLKSIAEQVNLMIDKDEIIPQDLIRFLPNFNTSVSLHNTFGQTYDTPNNDMMWTILQEMRQDIKDLKLLFIELTKNSLFRNQNNAYSAFEDRDTSTIYPEVTTMDKPIVSYPANYSFEKSRSALPDRVIEQPIDDQSENLNLEQMEKRLIIKALKKYNNRRKKAADELGISERTLYRKIIDYDLEDIS
jgi:transcriptional regulator with PAS, ATPase and Fis domain